MKKLIVIFTVLSFFLVGCKSYVKHKYHFDRTFDFKDKTSFLNHFEKNKLFDKEHILYLPIEGYMKFVNEKLQQDSSIIYQGCYINDSTFIKRSIVLNGNTSCMGRMDNEIENNFKQTVFPDSIMDIGKSINVYHLKWLYNENAFHLNPQKKMTLFLVYSYSLGAYYEDLYRKVMKLNKQYDSTTDTYLICIDPVYLLK